MTSRHPSGPERALIGDREDYVIDMLFQLARISAQGGDAQGAEMIKAVWEALRRRAAARLDGDAREAG